MSLLSLNLLNKSINFIKNVLTSVCEWWCLFIHSIIHKFIYSIIQSSIYYTTVHITEKLVHWEWFSWDPHRLQTKRWFAAHYFCWNHHTLFQDSLINRKSKEQIYWKCIIYIYIYIYIYRHIFFFLCNNLNVFNVTSDQLNAPLRNKIPIWTVMQNLQII